MHGAAGQRGTGLEGARGRAPRGHPGMASPRRALTQDGGASLTPPVPSLGMAAPPPSPPPPPVPSLKMAAAAASVAAGRGGAGPRAPARTREAARAGAEWGRPRGSRRGAMDCYTANWNPLGEEAFYRKSELYAMEWGLREELRDCLVAAAPYGGPIALLRNSARREKSPGARPLLDTFSASGLLLASIPVSGARTGPGGGSGASAPPGCPEGLLGNGVCGGHWGLRARAREPARPGRGDVGAVPGSREHRAPCTGLGQTRGKLPSSRGAAEPGWKSGQVVQLGWTASEDLLCIQEDGTVLIYNLFCEFKRHFSMGNVSGAAQSAGRAGDLVTIGWAGLGLGGREEVLQNHVLEAKVFHTEYGTGVAILTGAHRFSLATNIDDLKLRRMPEVPGLQKPPSCWAVLSQDRVTIVLLAVGQDLYLLDNTSCSVVTPPGMSPSAGAYLQMSVSFNYRCLALFTDTGYIWMGLATLKPDLRRPGGAFQQLPSGHRWAQLCRLALLRALAPCGAGAGASFFSRTCALCWFSSLIAPLGAWLQQHTPHLPSPLPDPSLSQEKLCEFNCSIRAPPKQMVCSAATPGRVGPSLVSLLQAWGLRGSPGAAAGLGAALPDPVGFPRRCMRPRSRQRAVVMAWDRQLMVVGNSTECIQYPLGRRGWGRSRWPAQAPWAAAAPAPSTAAPSSPGSLSGEHRFVLDEDSYLVPELDGVRILSRTSHEFLHEIPEASQEIFKIASMAPGALLLEAQKEYEVWHTALLHACLLPQPGGAALVQTSTAPVVGRGRPGSPSVKESQKADEYLREIKDQKLLPEAVSQCIEAAGYEHEPETQKSLLRAASFGKCFIDKFPPESFVRMCQDLRVLNAIRDYQIGIPLTFTQYPASWGGGRGSPGGRGSGRRCSRCWSELGSVPVPRAGCPSVPGSRAAGLALGYKRLTIEVLLDSPGGSAGSERSGPLVRLAELRGPSPALLQGSLLSLHVPPRLVLRRLYPLAIRICEYLRLSEIQGVQQKDKSDEEVAYAINQKLGDTPGISYSEIAARAYDCGRTELAIKLLEYEPRSGEQVPLLLKMKRSKLALSKAIESGDTDLAPGGCSASGQQNSLGKGAESGGRWLWLCAAWDGGGGSCLGPAEQGGKHGDVPCARVSPVPLLVLRAGRTSQNAAPAPVYTVVLHLKNELNRGTFFMTLQNQPVALSLYRQVGAARSFLCPLPPAPPPRGGPGAAAFCKHQERETLKDLYNQDDNHQELGNFHVHSSYSEKVCARRGQQEGGGRAGGSSLPPPGPWQRAGRPPWGRGWGGHVLPGACACPRIEGRVAALQNAVDEYYKAKNEFAAKVSSGAGEVLQRPHYSTGLSWAMGTGWEPQGPHPVGGVLPLGQRPSSQGLVPQATEDQIKLLRLQRHLQEDFDKPYLDLSLHDTVSTLILDGHHKKAEQLYRDFKIPDKRYWWLKINALATRGDWEEMEKFSKSKKSPIGYLPFVEIAVKHHNRYEAKKYAPRVTPEQRVKAFILVGWWGGLPGVPVFPSPCSLWGGERCRSPQPRCARRDLEQAADAAIEHKSEAELSCVLARCSPSTDSALIEKLNRARAQLMKK
ncbi:Vacuolar protein sorting-associated protein 16-like protein [Aix galericulata]|nr:Vacuolar protein sorting-associated protein 16-like protein [Aix galericulata]